MKLLSILSTLLISITVHAYPIPQNFCYSGCSEAQKQIWERYEQSTHFETTREATMYSGACYHLSRSYQADQPHFAGVLIDHNENGELTFSGRFSFFASTNNYATWSLDQARAEFPKRHLMEVGANEAFLDLNPGGETIWYYWLKDQPQTQNLLLIATWGIFHQVFCELSPNEGAL